MVKKISWKKNVWNTTIEFCIKDHNNITNQLNRFYLISLISHWPLHIKKNVGNNCILILIISKCIMNKNK